MLEVIIELPADVSDGQVTEAAERIAKTLDGAFRTHGGSGFRMCDVDTDGEMGVEIERGSIVKMTMRLVPRTEGETIPDAVLSAANDIMDYWSSGDI